MGDMHASMGDGEICGTGVEIGGDVLIQVGLLKRISTEYPVTETATSWITHGVADEDIQLAMKIACEEAAALLVKHWNFTYEDAFIFLSVACDLGIAQNVHPCKGTVIAKLTVPKIDACPTPFR
jgi:amidase